MSRQRLIWVLAGVLLAAVTVWVHYEVKVNLTQIRQPEEAVFGGSVEQAGRLSLGETVPDFLSVDLHGASVSLSEYRNREVVVLDFWATWCQPCIRSLPSLEALNEEFDQLGAVFLAVNVGEGPALVREFVEDMAFTVRVVMDEQEDIRDTYGVRGIPQLVVVDRDGRAAHIEVGFPPLEALAAQREERLRELLADLTGQDGA